MPSKKEGIIVLYPEYFDKAIARRDGRKVPRAFAVASPDLKTISNAARKLGFKNLIDEKHHFSHRWFDKRGRVLILSRTPLKGDGKKLSKTAIIAIIGKRLKTREETKEDEG